MLPLKALREDPSLSLSAFGGGRQSLVFLGLQLCHSDLSLYCHMAVLSLGVLSSSYKDNSHWIWGSP